MGTLIKEISPEKQASRGWGVTLNGNPVAEVSKVEIEHPKFGTLAYGLTPGGYDGWSFRETGGGGSVLIPFAKVAGEVHIGLLEQTRHNQGGKVMNLPRGFLEPGESHFRAAVRELGEEISIDDARTAITGLPGEPGNPNSAFFETLERGEGVKFFAVELSTRLLEKRDDGRYAFIEGVLEVDPQSKAAKLAEQILDASFMPWFEAAALSDLFTVAGVARLMAYLHTRG